MIRLRKRVSPLKALTVLAGGLFMAPNPAHGAPQEALCVGDMAQPLRVEIAATPEARQKGLMGRESLAPYSGMLFRFDPPASASQGFYMYRTLIPLDIAFLDADGRILALRTMTPCESRDPRRCRVYRPGTDYPAALEVNAGFFERHRVAVGDRIRPAQEGRCTPE
ncbi:MAG: hypothetical protein CL543_02675 [Alcanivorax sp.]|nr:hypothetical protein [Alcanivorax sp.]